jgi:hypothetical protein
MINADIAINSASGLDFELLNYSPQTVNTKVQSSGTQGSSTGATSGSSASSTIGSSTAQTNSYGSSVSAGLSGMGDAISPSVSATANYEHSSTVTHEQSATVGTEQSHTKSDDLSNSASMSIKDWGAYSLVNPTNKNPSWTFGQEYPWDVIQCRRTNGNVKGGSNQKEIVIPTEMIVRLYDGVSLYPPSSLSMFGLNFVMKACWLITLDDDSPAQIEIDHTVNYFAGSHVLTVGNPSVIAVFMDPTPVILNDDGDGNSAKTTLDLDLMALDPLGAQAKAAIIGFIPSKFIVEPAPEKNGTAPVPFQIVSTTNDLMIVDTTDYSAITPADDSAGFAASETAMTANFGPTITALQITMYFKVIDLVDDYTLFMKHWKTGATGVSLTLVINGDTNSAITKYVDSLEAEGGEKNLLSVRLRNQDYASIDYHDYLQLGLNSIQVTLKPIGGAFVEGDGYQLRAVSVEKV